MQPKTKLAVSWLRIGYILVAAVAMYVLISQLSSFRGSLSELKSSTGPDDLVILIAVIAICLLSPLTYYFLALKRIRYIRTIFVELGINTLNRLLPAGLGGIGANYVYLSKSRHTKAQAQAVVAANTVIGIIANLLLLAFMLTFFRLPKLHYSKISPGLIIAGCAVVLVASAAVLLIPGLRRKIRHNFKITLRNLFNYRALKLRLLGGVLCQIGLALASVLALFFSLRAVHSPLPISSVMLTYTFGIWLGAIIPAPGGVGSVEAGLVSGLLAFKVDLVQAAAAVLLFRLISFWLPLIIGTIPLFWSYRRGYL